MNKCKDCRYYRGGQHVFCYKERFVSDDHSTCPDFESEKKMITTRNQYINPFRIASIDEMHAVRDSYSYKQVRKEYNKMFGRSKVEKVIFNPPATIVYWSDGSKTVVKAQDSDMFDKEKGFAMACAKKFFGNKGNYYNEFRKHGADKSPIDEMYDSIFGSELSCTCEFDPGVVEQLCEIGNVTDHSTFPRTSGRYPSDFESRVNAIKSDLELFAFVRGLDVRMSDRSVPKGFEIRFEYELNGETYIFENWVSYEDMSEETIINIQEKVQKWFDRLTKGRD